MAARRPHAEGQAQAPATQPPPAQAHHATHAGLPVLGFATAAQFEAWLAAQPATSPGLWLKLAKKGSGLACLGKPAAIEAALCHGWIDGQLHPPRRTAGPGT